MPAGNRAFWKAKLARNAARDREVTRALKKAGWRVLRIWEHDLAAKHWPRVARRVALALRPALHLSPPPPRRALGW